MTRITESPIVPVVIVVDGKVGLTLWAPEFTDNSGETWQSFLGDNEHVYAFASCEELAEHVAHGPDSGLDDHPAWTSVQRKRPDELRAQSRDVVNFDAIFEAVSEGPSPATVAELAKAVQLAEGIADCCDDGPLTDLLHGRAAYRTPAAAYDQSGRQAQKTWDLITDEILESWEWIISRVAHHIRWFGDPERVVLDAVRHPPTVTAPWAVPVSTAAVNRPDSSSPTAPVPPVTSTVVLTLLFGIFGAFAAASAARRARASGASTGRYWGAFWLSLLGSILVWVLLYVALIAAILANSQQ